MKKIAIVRRNGLGDLLCSYPLIRYIQLHEPGTEITLFVDKRNAPLVPYLPAVDHVVLFPAKGNKYLNLWKTAKQHRKKFDQVYSAKTSPMKLMNLFLYWLGAKKQFAYVDTSWHSRLINHPLPFDSVSAKQKHQALKSLQMVAPHLDHVPEELYPTLSVPPGTRPRFSHPAILVSASTNRKASMFDSERYAHLLNRVNRCKPIAVLVLALPEDRVRAEDIANRLECEHQVYFSRNFEQFMLCLDSADFYFVGDGGVGHLGAALGKRGLVLYGETSPTEWRPLSKKMEILYHPIDVNHLADEAIFQAIMRIVSSGGEN